MQPFWPILIAPLLEALEPKVVVLAGRAGAAPLATLVRDAVGPDGVIHMLDGSPSAEVSVELAFLDGADPAVVLAALEAFDLSARAAGALPPVVVIHDVGSASEAVRQFLEASSTPWKLYEIPGYGGLSVLAPALRLARVGRLRMLLESTQSTAFLRRLCYQLELARLEAVERLPIGPQSSSAVARPGPNAESQTLQQEVSRLRSELGASRLRSELRAQELQTRLAEARHREAAAQARTRDAQAAISAVSARLQAQRDWATQAGDRLRDRILELHADAVAVRSELEAARDALGALDAELESALQRERAAVSGEAAAARRELEALAESARMRQERDELREQLSQMQHPLRQTFANGRAALVRERVAAYRNLIGALPPSEWVDPLAGPLPVDRRGVLVADADQAMADVVVCVHDAPEQTRRCLWALLEKTRVPFRLIVVNDGSGPETTSLLAWLATRHRQVEFLQNDAPPHGYATAANAGLRAARAPWVVLLNSDTEVTPGWLERLLAAGEKDESIGIMGPLSNAATHQSIPEAGRPGSWTVNQLPDWLEPDGMALLVARHAPGVEAKPPFLNGFCYAIRRQTLETVGVFDDARFGGGYGEEDDYSLRAAAAGFRLAIATDAYVHHHKSSSFGERRAELNRRHRNALVEKHGDRARVLAAALDQDRTLEPLRNAVAEALSDPRSVIRKSRGHQQGILLFAQEGDRAAVRRANAEAAALGEIGASVTVVVASSVDELATPAAEAAAVCAVGATALDLLRSLPRRRRGQLHACSLFDATPVLEEDVAAGLGALRRALRARPQPIFYADNHWLANLIGERLGVAVEVVSPLPGGGPVGRPVQSEGFSIGVGARDDPAGEERAQEIRERLQAGLGGRAEVWSYDEDGPDLARLAGAQMVVDVSPYQPSPQLALEVMAYGCVPIISRIGATWEVASDGVDAVAFDPLDSDELLTVVSDLVQDPERVRLIGERAKLTAARYSVQRAAVSRYVLFELRRERTPRSAQRARPTVAPGSGSRSRLDL